MSAWLRWGYRMAWCRWRGHTEGEWFCRRCATWTGPPARQQFGRITISGPTDYDDASNHRMISSRPIGWYSDIYSNRTKDDDDA